MKRLSLFSLPETVAEAARVQTAFVLPAGEAPRIVVALSGGPDSTALLHALHQAIPEALMGAAHFHHGLRGVDADADAGFCAAQCARIGVPLAIALGKVIPAGRSPQAAARTDRYEFLLETMHEWGANCLAVAHTSDDQAETVLGRVLRGTSVDGLSGIPATREIAPGLFIIRPLLPVSRAQVEAYCAGLSIVPRQDPSNQGQKYMRSKLRQRIPAIAQDFNPRLGDALRRLSENARIDSDFLKQEAEALAARAVLEQEGGHARLSVAALTEAHPALTRRVLLRAIASIYPPNQPVLKEEATTAAFVEALETLLRTRTGAVNLPGNVQARLVEKRKVLILTSPHSVAR